MPHFNGHDTMNILLASLLPEDLALLAPHLAREALQVKQVLVPLNQPIEHVWFLEGGVGSVVAVSADISPTEVGIFGREGFAGTALLLGAGISPHEIFIQVNGHNGLKIAAAPFLAAVDHSRTLRIALLRYVQTVITQAANSTVSNAHQRIEARLARWLLMCHDRYDSDDIPLTHEFMAIMVAAERSGVTVSLHVLEGAGMIRSKRGRVVILDRQKLEELAGDGYGQPEAEYSRLIAPFGKLAPRIAAA
ncbi:MAG: Crp/Fnr family transcriptional regulator [Sphingomonas sp.]|jgi:CRP-like cAMP-binding protein|uniref:Crp/Fnr family transcriptional regulator n=1 Tax=Sphingomonas sp. CD22 TaxID=3100214 RepID=UPI0011FCBC08|nr:Crp/Fnr family transcriptional regulator [Sphingomonas sp. CD22]MEA1083181.1 Crp/Fnr family transcriptional regulator [Sphingomonas sp. CD22]RZL58925.1 MAG: Crp/Fnr family transcriptional regulator [Sphingomonas sp.]